MRLLNQLLRDSNYWIRFELGLIQLNGKDYFKEMRRRAITIVNSIFDDDDDILLVVSISNDIGYKPIYRANIKRFIKNKKIIYGLTCKTVPYEFDEENTEMETKQYSLKVKKQDIRLDFLIQSIGNKDFRMKPRVDGSVYLVNLTKEMLFHMYDDRGCDVYSLEKGKLLPVYDKLRSWILDYDRIQIDCKFEEGLFNINETPAEVEKRLHQNKKQVKENNLNEYNTCYITHELEIPKVLIEECLKEMTQTGFEITFEQKFDSYIIRAKKAETLAYINYQTELMSLYSKKYKGKYNGWSAVKTESPV